MWQNSPKANFFTILSANSLLLFFICIYIVGVFVDNAISASIGTTIVAPNVLWLILNAIVIITIVSATRPVETFKLGKPTAKNVYYSVLLAFFLYLATTVVFGFWVQEYPQPYFNSLNFQPGTNDILITLISFSACVAVPFTEELVFRGVVQNAYERKLGIGALFVSSALFAIMHGSVFSIVNAAVMGVAIGYVYIKTRNFWCAFILHAVFNFFVLSGVVIEYILNLPWVLQGFPLHTMNFSNPTYALYQLGFLIIGGLMSFVMFALIVKENKKNKAKPSCAYRGQKGQTKLLVAVIILMFVFKLIER